MESEPIAEEWKNLLRPLSLSELRHSERLSTLPTRMRLAAPYPYYGIEFGEPLYRCALSGRDFVVFGRDLGGYYAADDGDGTVFYLHTDDGETQALFANTSLNAFCACHNLFIEYAKRRVAREIEAEAAAEVLDRLLREKDPSAIENDETFWPMRLYELSEDFFPLDDSRLDFHRRHSEPPPSLL